SPAPQDDSRSRCGSRRLDKANLFPTTNIDEIVAITRAELGELHSAANQYLVNKLIAAHSETDAVLAKNAERMLVALASYQETCLQLLIRKGLLEGNLM